MANIFSVIGAGSDMFTETFDSGRDAIRNFRAEQQTDHIIAAKERQERLIVGVRSANQNIRKALQGVTDSELAEINMHCESIGLPLITVK